jgi:hypothetical protein
MSGMINARRLIAVALSLAATGFFMVVLLCLQAIFFNRLVGLNYPIWVGRTDSAMEEVNNVHGRFRLREKKENLRSEE